MKIHAISDLHLSLSANKPMDVFGEHWIGHHLRIEEHWRATVAPEDIVLVPGDISWALKLEQAQQDLDWIRALPGRKVFVKGNHDYWWSGLSKVKQAAGEGMFFIQNNIVEFDGCAFGGARLWDFPFVRWPMPSTANNKNKVESTAPQKDDETIRARELHRLELSLQALANSTAKVKIAMVHYPPISAIPEENPLTDLFGKFGISLVIYGHIHSAERPIPAVDCILNGCHYLLTSCDMIDFRLIELADTDS